MLLVSWAVQLFNDLRKRNDGEILYRRTRPTFDAEENVCLLMKTVGSSLPKTPLTAQPLF